MFFGGGGPGGMSFDDDDGSGGGMPFGGMFGGMGGMPGMPGMGGMPGGRRGGAAAAPRKAPTIERDLLVSLEELYSGTTKKLRITRKVMDGASGRQMEAAKVLSVDVQPGYKDGTALTFEGEGDEEPGRLPADIKFVIRTKPHARFEREGDNLVTRVTVPLADALAGARVAIRTLDDRTVDFTTTAVITPDTVHRVPGEGMPSRKNKGQRGDLLVRFAIAFPRVLSADQKDRVRQALA
eukprot:c9571_g1_i1.p3 GENE.c9571_g1_i1~~c9571_g1_i1.p3  ORF type:complete len:238 (+),score=43.13 c9571_g1_i1:3-716(+)